MKKASELLAQVREIQLANLRRRGCEIATAAQELRAGLATSLVEGLPLHSTIAAHIVRLERQFDLTANEQLTVLRELVGWRSRCKLCAGVAIELSIAEDRAEIEKASLEAHSQATGNRLPQGECD